MKMTVVSRKDGALVGAVFGHVPRPDPTEFTEATEGFRAGLLAGPGQELHILDVSEDFLQIESAAELKKRLEEELWKARRA